MPYREPDPADPHLLVGVALPGDPARLREMVYVFAEEYARLGFDERRLMRLCRSPFYAGLHRALRVLGEPVVRAIVEECVAVWGRGARGRAPAPPGGA